MSATFLGDVKNNVIHGSTSHATLTGSISTNPTRGVNVTLGDGMVTAIFSFGTIHADSTGVYTLVESTSGSNGTWTTCAGVGATTLSITTADSNTTAIRSFVPTKAYVGVLCVVAGATQSIVQSVVLMRAKKQS